MMFKNIFYEPWKNKMHLWELNDNGETEYKTFDHKIEYYVKDRSGNSQIKSIDGVPVIKQETSNRDIIKQLKASGERIFESDLAEEVKFLHKRYSNCEDTVDIKKYNIYNVDIETEYPESPRINLIGIQDFHTNKIYQFGLHDYKGDFKETEYFYCESEQQLLERFCKFLKFKKVNILIGWNCVKFDIPEIQKRIDELGLKCSMSPIGKIYRDKFSNTVRIAGIDVLDCMTLYEKFTMKNQPSFSLDYIGELEVQENKVSYEGQLSDLWKSDPEKFIIYNAQDLKLVKKIDNKKKFVNLAIQLGVSTLTPFEKVESSVATIEGYILKHLHKNNMVMEDITHNIAFEKTRKIIGGYVETHPGFYLKGLSIDASSMYPHNIMMYNISKETKVLNPKPEEIPNLIKTPINGVYYRKDKKGILPIISKTLFEDRKKYKKLMFKYKKEKNYELAEHYNTLQLIEKTKINSIFGCCAEVHFHWYDFDNGSVITAAGREAIQYLSNRVDQYFTKEFYKIAKEFYPNSTLDKDSFNSSIKLLCDTDSVFFRIEELYNHLGKSNMSFLDFALDFQNRVLEPFLDKSMNEFAERYNTENLLYFKREKIITKIYIQAKKKYCVQVLANEDDIYETPEFSITGLETKKSDTCKYSRNSIEKLIDIMFEGGPEDRPNKLKMLNHIRNANKEFQKQDISDIALPKAVKTYDKYDTEISEDEMDFESGTPIFNKASMIYNMVIKDLNLPYVEIKNGYKMKYIFTKTNNKYQAKYVAFIGKYPKEFESIFEPDIKKIFEKQYLNIVQRIFDVLEFGQITMKDSNLMKLLED